MTSDIEAFAVAVNDAIQDCIVALGDDLEQGSHELNNDAWQKFNTKHRWFMTSFAALQDLVRRKMPEDY